MSRARRAGGVLAASLLLVTLAGCGDEPSSDGLSVHSSPEEYVPASPAETTEGGAIATRLAGALYVPLARDAGEGNVAFSPSSVATALGYLHAASAGDTRSQIEDLLGTSEEVDLDRSVGGIDISLNALAGTAPTSRANDAQVEVKLADAIWGDSSTTWADEYLDVLATGYGVPGLQVDFGRDVNKAQAEVNDWVAQQTGEAVKGFLPKGAVDADTRILLTALATIEAPWFDELTVQAPAAFTRPDGTTVEVPMYGATLAGRTQSTDQWKAITLGLAGQGLAVTFILPAPGKLRAVEDDLTEVLPAATAGSQLVELKFTLPAFSLEREVPVVDALTAAGLTAPFEDAGDDLSLTGFESGQGADALVHRATLGVDASGVALAGPLPEADPAAPAAPIDAIRFDRTFLFVVHDVIEGTPLLLGRVTDPTAS